MAANEKTISCYLTNEEPTYKITSETKKFVYQRPQFKDSDTCLTPLLESKTGYFVIGMYNAIAITSIGYQLLVYSSEDNVWDRDADYMRTAFEGFIPYGLAYWIFLFIYQYLVCFPFAMVFRSYRNVMSVFIVSTIILFMIGIFLFHFMEHVGPVTKGIIALEGIRLGMKTISFLQEMTNLEEERKHILRNAKMSQVEVKTIDNHVTVIDHSLDFPLQDHQVIPSLKHFTYFLFCPTAIYASSYPMRTERSWSKICGYLYLLLTIIFFALKLSSLVITPLSTIGKEKLYWRQFVFDLYTSTLFFGVYLPFVAVAFGWLHLWQNIWAELLRFGDRRFYGRFWREFNIGSFFLQWNFVIQNWFFRYFYVPSRKMFGKSLGAIITLFFSGYYHDAVTFCITGYFIPNYMIMMPLDVIIFGQLIKKMTRFKAFNYTSIVTMFMIQGLWYYFYVAEYYARKNCPAKSSSIVMDVLTPRIITCLDIS